MLHTDQTATPIYPEFADTYAPDLFTINSIGRDLLRCFLAQHHRYGSTMSADNVRHVAAIAQDRANDYADHTQLYIVIAAVDALDGQRHSFTLPRNGYTIA